MWWIFTARIDSYAGHFALRGKRLRRETPVLAVVDPESDLVPPSSVMPFLNALPHRYALPHRNWTLWHYEPDTGVALRHVGVLAGRNAHSILWPEILAWIRMSYTSASTHGDRRIGSVV